MKKNPQPLSPTLWRTCRVLASPIRLRCLKLVLDNLGITVETVAAGLQITEAKASLCLRALQSRGLLSSTRRSRWLIYSPETDPKVKAAQPFLDAVSTALHSRRISLDNIEKAVTAYTHPRRIVIVRLLNSSGPLNMFMLSDMSDISLPALCRHLQKLVNRQVVSETGNDYALRTPRTALAQALLDIVLNS